MDPSQIWPRVTDALPPTLPLGVAPELGSTFGALLLSTFFSLILYGLTAHQAFQYFRMYRGDVPFLKILISGILAADTFHSATLMHTCYYYFVTNYFNPLAFLVGAWSTLSLPLSTGIIIILTQSFYVRRIYLADKRYLPIVLLVVCLILIELGFIIAITVVSIITNTFEALRGHIWMITTIFSVAASVDLILTGTLVFILRNSYTGFERTNRILDTISLYAVIATSLNTALTVPAFIYSIALPQSFIYLAIAMPATKVYSNSVLAVLNCRQSLKDSLNATGPIEIDLVQRTDPSALTRGSASVDAALAQPELLSLPSSYATVKARMTRSAGQEGIGEYLEGMDAKVRGPE